MKTRRKESETGMSKKANTKTKQNHTRKATQRKGRVKQRNQGRKIMELK